MSTAMEGIINSYGSRGMECCVARVQGSRVIGCQGYKSAGVLGAARRTAVPLTSWITLALPPPSGEGDTKPGRQSWGYEAR